MKTIRRFIVALSAIWGCGIYASDTPPVAVTLIPHGTTFKSFADYEQSIRSDENTYKGEEIRSAEFEIRDTKNRLRIIRFPYRFEFGHGFKDVRPARAPSTWSDGFPEEALRRIGKVAPGEYQLAFYVNGIRASNVVSIQIDPAYDASKAPTLQLGILEPHPLGRIARVILWAIGPTPTDEQFTNIALYSSPVWIDGLERVRSMVVWTGSVGPVQSGHRFFLMIEPGGYTPPADPEKEHTYVFKFGRHATTPLRVDPFETKLGMAWDGTSSQLEDLPRSRALLQGKILNAKAEPAIGYQVFLRANGAPQATEYTDPQGEYTFPNIPPGTFTVVVFPPPPAGSPTLSKDGVILEGDKTCLINFSFKNRYRFSGRVVEVNGKPVRDVDVMTTWKDHDTGFEFCASTKSGDDGSYQVDGPYPKISYVGIGCTGTHPAPRYDVKPGDTNVIFIMKR